MFFCYSTFGCLCHVIPRFNSTGLKHSPGMFYLRPFKSLRMQLFQRKKAVFRLLFSLARPKGFEPPFFRIGICCVIQLRHGRKLNLKASSDEEAVRRTEGETVLRNSRSILPYSFSPSVFCFAKSTSLVRGRQNCKTPNYLIFSITSPDVGLISSMNFCTASAEGIAAEQLCAETSIDAEAVANSSASGMLLPLRSE